MEIRSTEERDMIAIRTSTPVEDLPEIMGACYAEIMQYLGPLGIQPTGPPFAVYRNMDMSSLDVEIGFPVAPGTKGKGRIQPGKIPGGRAAVAVHTGPYARLGDTYDRLASFIKERGLKAESFCYEFYLNDPETTPPAALETEIFFPLRG